MSEISLLKIENLATLFQSFEVRFHSKNLESILSHFYILKLK